MPPSILLLGGKRLRRAAVSLAELISGGSGSFGSMSPIGQGWVAGSGNRLLTATGVKLTSLFPVCSVTHP